MENPDYDEIDKSVAYKMVFKDLNNVNMFKGIYDAKNGKSDFMDGICTVMEFIANGISEECHASFTDMFTQNMVRSEEKANGKK